MFLKLVLQTRRDRKHFKNLLVRSVWCKFMSQLFSQLLSCNFYCGFQHIWLLIRISSLLYWSERTNHKNPGLVELYESLTATFYLIGYVLHH